MRLLSIGLLLHNAHAVIRGISFYGLETQAAKPVCSWVNPPDYYISILANELDLNTIRLPFSYQYVMAGDWREMDAMVQSCKAHGMAIIMDYHRTWNTHQGPVVEEGISFQDFVNCWYRLLDRYRDQTWGVGIFNEVQPEDPNYVNQLHRRFIPLIEERYPGRFTYFAGCHGWGGNCQGVDLSNMTTFNRTYIEWHQYSFSNPSTPEGWAASAPGAHGVVGEFGWKHRDSVQRKWAETFISWLKGHNMTDAVLWTIAHSSDTEGLWEDDCLTIQWDKFNLLKTLWSP